MHCCIPTPTADSNTSTDMIWVTLNMPSSQRSAVLQTVTEMSGNFTLSGEWSPCILHVEGYEAAFIFIMRVFCSEEYINCE